MQCDLSGAGPAYDTPPLCMASTATLLEAADARSVQTRDTNSVATILCTVHIIDIIKYLHKFITHLASNDYDTSNLKLCHFSTEARSLMRAILAALRCCHVSVSDYVDTFHPLDNFNDRISQHISRCDQFLPDGIRSGD